MILNSKLALYATVSLLTQTLWAANDHLVRRGIEQVEMPKQELARLAELTRTSSPEWSAQLTVLVDRFSRAQETLRASLVGGGPSPVPGPIPNPPPPPPPSPLPPPQPIERRWMTAVCELDDDSTFDLGQTEKYNLQGPDVAKILGDCDALARGRFPQGTYSIGIHSLAVVERGSRDLKATCEIDDDSEFTSGQYKVGEVLGRSIQELAMSCAEISKRTYPNGTSGIEGIDYGNARYPMSAICEIDDDPSFTPGQVSLGRIQGNDVQSLTADCAFLARSRFGANGSSGLKDLRYE